MPRSKAPSAAEVAGRRIVAEAEAAQRARAAAEAEAAQQARAAAQAAERAVAERAAAEAEAAAQRERAVRARQRRREQAAAAAAPGSTTEASPAGPAAPVESRPVAAEPLPPPAPVADPHPPRAPAVAPPPPPDEEVLFVPSGTEAPSPDEGEVLFDGSQRAEGTGLPPSTAADVDGPPPPPRQHPADPIGQLPVLEPAEELPEARRTSAEPPVALEPGDDLPAPQLAARLVSEVLHERDDGTPPTAEDAPEPSPVRTETQALRAGRWVLVTVVAAVALALLFPLAVRAVLELVSLS